MGTCDWRKCPRWGNTAHENSCLPEWIFFLQLNEKIEGEAQQTLVLFGVRCSRRTEKRDPQDSALTGEPVLGLREYGYTVPIFTKICVLHRRVNRLASLGNEKAYLVSANFELGCIPRRVLVRRTSNMAPGCLVRRYIAVNVEGQLDCDLSVRVVGRNNDIWSLTLQELMALMPISLCVEYKLIEGVRRGRYQPV